MSVCAGKFKEKHDLHVNVNEDMWPYGKEVTDDSIADSHDETSQHDRVLPTSLVWNAMSSHWNKESQECNDDG